MTRIGHSRQMVHWWPEVHATGTSAPPRWFLVGRCECRDEFACGGDSEQEVRDAHDEWTRTHPSEIPT